jgi:hypothetical protein
VKIIAEKRDTKIGVSPNFVGFALLISSTMLLLVHLPLSDTADSAAHYYI